MELCVKKTASDIQFLECFCGQETLFMVGKTSQLITFRSSRSKVSCLDYFARQRPSCVPLQWAYTVKPDFGLGGRFSPNDYISPGLKLVPLFTVIWERSGFLKMLPYTAWKLLPHRVFITTLSSLKIKWLRNKAKFRVTVTPGFLQNASGDLRHLISYPLIDLQLFL